MEKVKSKKKNCAQYLYLWLPVAIYCYIIFYLSSRPVKAKLLSFYHADKIVHMVEYFLLSFLFSRALYNSFPLSKNSTIIFWILFLTIGYGISDEVHQYFVPHREADIFDVAFDAVGAYIGQMGYFFLRRMRYA